MKRDVIVKYYCPHCDTPLLGQEICPACDNEVSYSKTFEETVSDSDLGNLDKKVMLDLWEEAKDIIITNTKIK